jgi:transposase
MTALSGQQGLLGQVQGRIADDAAYWLAGATPAWRDAVQVVERAVVLRPGPS